MDITAFYIVIVGILFLLAISDLIVGVSNDAVNFLNSAIGSKVAPFKIIMIVASLGVLMGAIFSTGMMEVARKGIFRPEMFVFSEVMLIFLAVMLTDIILIDFFNTFGLPTSTTVSLIFELLGASVAISIMKITGSDGGLNELGNYINSGNALAIISGIFISIAIAFTCGLVFQFITRLIFTFDLSKTFKYYGAIWGGVALTSILYFIILKGLKGSSLANPDLLNWIKSNTLLVLSGSVLIFSFIFQLIISFTRFNILKIVVLAGTFALALAFAGNDLVNFIGVPLAGYESFRNFTATLGANPETFTMESLTGAVQTPVYFLLIAGFVMVLTLWLSKKARTVSETEVNLGRQNEGDERFPSTMFSRTVVRETIRLSNFVRGILPNKVNEIIDKRTSSINEHKGAEAPAFDLLRASVNLVVSSILIATGTSLKLPLSTTYVTFMVAMASSLADGAWGRESAVYRVSGVLTVIAGWFFTAFIAFTVSFIIASIIFVGGFIAISIMILVAILLIVKSHTIHRKRQKEKEESQLIETEMSQARDSKDVFTQCNKRILSTTLALSKLYYLILHAFILEKRKQLQKLNEEAIDLNKQTKEYKKNIHQTIQMLSESSIESGAFYVQTIDSLRSASNSLRYISEPLYNHVNNNHSPFNDNQITELKDLRNEFNQFFGALEPILANSEYNRYIELENMEQSILDHIAKMKKKQVKMVKNGDTSTRNSILYLDILGESKNMLLHLMSMVRAMNDFKNMSN